MKNNIEITNKKASFNYDFVETYVAGIVLNGAEITAIKDGNMNISEAYCYFVADELFLKNAIIAQSPNRDRKLLLNRAELRKIRDAVKIKGLTVVPTKIFINDRHLAKVLIAVARGKKTYDKRETIKKRDIERETKREL